MSVDAVFLQFGIKNNRILLCLLIILSSSNVIECCRHAMLLGTSLNIVVFFWQNPHISATHQLRQQKQTILSNTERRQTTEFRNEYQNSKSNRRHSDESTLKKSYHTNTRKTSYYDTGLIESRIINGKIVRPGRYPFYSFPVGNWLCGSTLIYEDILVTAAHCYEAFVSYGVYIGGTEIDGSESEYIPVDSEYPHVNYTPGYEYNDIMLVKLSFPSSSPIVEIDYNEVITRSDDFTHEHDDDENENNVNSIYYSGNDEINLQVATVVGYGYTSTGTDATYSKTLLQTEIDLVPINKCIDYYGPDIAVDTMICATGDISSLNTTTNMTADACLGDSGGPLLFPFYENIVISSRNVTVTKLVYKQIGIVSFGDGCGVPNTPAIYTKLSAFKKWIQNGICLLSSNPPSYCDNLNSTNSPSDDDDNDFADDDMSHSNSSKPTQTPSILSVAPSTTATTSFPTMEISSQPTVYVSPSEFPTSSPSLLTVNSDAPTARSSDVSTSKRNIPSILSDFPSSFDSMSPMAFTTTAAPSLLDLTPRPSNIANVTKTLTTASPTPTNTATPTLTYEPSTALAENGIIPYQTLLPSAITIFAILYQDGATSNSIDTKMAPNNAAVPVQTMGPSQPKNVYEGQVRQNNKSEKKKNSKNLARGIIAADLFTIHDDTAESSEATLPTQNGPSAPLIGSAGQQMPNSDGSRRYAESNTENKSYNSFDKNVLKSKKPNILDASHRTDGNERNAD